MCMRLNRLRDERQELVGIQLRAGRAPPLRLALRARFQQGTLLSALSFRRDLGIPGNKTGAGAARAPRRAAPSRSLAFEGEDPAGHFISRRRPARHLGEGCSSPTPLGFP